MVIPRNFVRDKMTVSALIMQRFEFPNLTALF